MATSGKPTAAERRIYQAGYAAGHTAGKAEQAKVTRTAWQEGHGKAMASWRAWYDSLPEALQSQIDAHQAAVRAEADAA